MTIKFMASYQTKPIYVFGSFGMLAFFVSLLAAVVRAVSEALPQGRLRANTTADSGDRDVCGWHSVSADGFAGGDAGAHLSRVAGEIDLCGARERIGFKEYEMRHAE